MTTKAAWLNELPRAQTLHAEENTLRFFIIANYMYVYCTVYSSRGGDMQITPILYNLLKNFGKDWDHAT
jgi:hypothetical protein